MTPNPPQPQQISIRKPTTNPATTHLKNYPKTQSPPHSNYHDTKPTTNPTNIQPQTNQNLATNPLKNNQTNPAPPSHHHGTTNPHHPPPPPSITHPHHHGNPPPSRIANIEKPTSPTTKSITTHN